MRSSISKVAMLTLAATLTACAPTSPTVPGRPTEDSLNISGPATVPPGTTAQFMAIARDAGGATRNVTSEAAWHSSDTSVLTIASGVATAHQAGEVNITAAFSGLVAVQDVTIVPPGTFRLQGNVASGSFEVEGASVQVTAGTGTGLTAVTGPAGLYRLYGVAGNIELSVSGAGYIPVRQTVTINGNTNVNFQLQPTVPPPQFAGTYSFTITADPSCDTTAPDALPAAARTRLYIATFTNFQGFRAVFSGADFLPDRNFFYGSVTPVGASLTVNTVDYYGPPGYPPPDMGEILPNGDVYCPSGDVELTSTGADFSGTLNGTIRIRRPPAGDLVAQCTSTHHTIAVTLRSGAGR